MAGPSLTSGNSLDRAKGRILLYWVPDGFPNEGLKNKELFSFEIDQTGIYRTLRHSFVFGLLYFLDDGHPPALLTAFSPVDPPVRYRIRRCRSPFHLNPPRANGRSNLSVVSGASVSSKSEVWNFKSEIPIFFWGGFTKTWFGSIFIPSSILRVFISVIFPNRESRTLS